MAGDITAGLDVFDPEPVPPDHPITRLPNVFLSPHSASRTSGGGAHETSRTDPQAVDRFAEPLS